MIERIVFNEEFSRVGINSALTPIGFLNLMEFLTMQKLNIDEESKTRGWSHRTTTRDIPNSIYTNWLKEQTSYTLKGGVIADYLFEGKDHDFNNRRLYSGKSLLKISGNSLDELERVQQVIIGSIAKRDYLPR